MAEAKRKPGRPPGSKNKNSSGKASANASGSSKGAQSKAQARARAIQAERKADRRVIDEIWAIIAIAVGIFLIVATVSNIGLDYLFILGFQMGVQGAAYATVLAQLLSVVLCLIRIFRKFPILHIQKEDF